MGLQAGNLLAGAIDQSQLTWRFGFYLSGGIVGLFFAFAYKFLPPDLPRADLSWKSLAGDVDFLGACLSMIGLGLLVFVLG